jgi:aspartate kinase
LKPSLAGTVISNKGNQKLPPVIVRKEQQVLMYFKSKDFSFVEEKPVAQLHQIFSEIKIKPNLSQHTAISLLCCFDDHAEKIGQLALDASILFDVEVEKNLSLLTIRHYDEATIEALTANRTIVLEQKTLQTIQALMR